MRQVVIYLRKTNSPLVYQTEFILPQMTHRFEVIRLWEQPTELFLNAPGLLPFAALTRTENPEEVLNEVAQLIERIENRQQQANLAAASSVLAGLVLDRELINRILRRDIMRESPIYQDILAEGREVGFQEGRQEAIAEIARNLLRSGMSVEQIMNVTGLTRERVEQLTNRDSE
ncbi:Rpn family recombination-promoting nuclease/putative transposase [Phormidium pseudopriestleyi]|uniref:Rpn family recombination-promoting nuclease/putative transposase n=1 Tax=Phormidium pseudopriestleyi TaxID=1759527 RepID=UPI001F5DC285|nr:Rpn family recombination-promoting nuclease/putative transposase [Phormidium pseudopriestleyi]